MRTLRRRAEQHQGSGETPAGGPVLRLDAVTAGYGDVSAVREATIDVHAGEVVALFGPNGAGKTTTLRAACGVLTPTAGRVVWMGRPTVAPLHRRTRDGVAFVPEERSVISTLSVRDNLRLGPGGVAGAVAHFPELQGLLDRRAGLLSGGEQQMLTLGRALARGPDALLVDELSLGLAPLVVDRLLAALRSAADERRTAVLLVEQQTERALSVADRWYMFNGGRIVEQGRAAEGVERVLRIYEASMSPLDGATIDVGATQREVN